MKMYLKLLLQFFFAMSPQLGGLGPKYQDLVIPFNPGEVEPSSNFYHRALAIISELLFIIYQIRLINNLICKYIMEPSNLKHLQR